MAPPSGQLEALRIDARVVAAGRRWHRVAVLFSPSFAILAWYRLNRAAFLRFGRRWTVVRAALSPLNPLIRIFVPSEIPYRADLGPGVRILHPQLGVVVSSHAVAGPGLILAGGNAIGGGAGDGPRLGAHVQLGINAVVIGAVTIGDHVTIGAGAVVVHDLPGPGTAVGNPARLVGGSETDAGEAGAGGVARTTI